MTASPASPMRERVAASIGGFWREIQRVLERISRGFGDGGMNQARIGIRKMKFINGVCRGVGDGLVEGEIGRAHV